MEEEEDGDASTSSACRSRPVARPLPTLNVDLQGKHRKAAAIYCLNQEILFLQEDLRELDTMGTASEACKEVILSIESKPDAFLPITKGPANFAWDRWFQGSHSSCTHKWWTHKRPESY